MLIKIVQNGIESDWFQLTKKAHRELIKIKPEAAIIHIEDVYPESPDPAGLPAVYGSDTGIQTGRSQTGEAR